MGLTISLFESQLLNSIIENNRKLYSNSILKNTKEFVDNITIPSFSMFDSLNYPNKQVGSDYHLTPYFFLTIKENLEDDYIKLVKIIKFKLGLYNCDANFRTSFGFRNISFEYLRNSGNNSEKVFKIAPGKLTGLNYYVILDIINECSQLSLEEFRGINIEEFERI